MDLLESDKLKIRILKCLNKEKEGLSLNGLKKKINASNFRSVKRNCDFLKISDLISIEDLIKIERKKINPQNYRSIKITSFGRSILKKFKNS
jgi:hypothetical protein